MSASFPNVFAKSVKRLSVIIVTYRSERDIYDCLRSLWQHCDIPKEQLEVIVVDNSPESDGMFARLRQLYGQELLLIHNTHNGGYGQGNNVGIRQASAPVILIMNPDVRLIEPVFKTAVEAFENDTALCMYGMKQMLSDTVKSPLSFDCTNAMNGYAAPVVSSLCNKLDLFLPRWMYLSGACFFIICSVRAKAADPSSETVYLKEAMREHDFSVYTVGKALSDTNDPARENLFIALDLLVPVLCLASGILLQLAAVRPRRKKERIPSQPTKSRR